MKQPAPKRILMIVENNPYPQDVRIFQEAQTLINNGYQVSIICPARREQSWYERINGVNVYRYPSPPSINSIFGYIWEYSYSLIASFILSLLVYIRHGFDYIHAANPPDTLFFIAIFYKILGKYFIFDHHDLAPELYRARFGNKSHEIIYKLLINFEKLSCRFADHVIAPNQSYKEIEMQRSHILASHISVVRNGPDLMKFNLSGPFIDIKQVGKLIIGYAGTMGFQDGVDYLLRAIHFLEKEMSRTDFYCILLGDGDATSSLKLLANDLGISNYLLFTGWITHREVAHYLFRTDICVAPEPSNPYNDHSTMIKIMEYMVMGKPIVAFDLPEHRVTAKDAALYAHPNDEYDLARNINKLMDDPERRKKIGQFGRERVEKELAWIHQEKNLIKAYATFFTDS